MNRSRAIAIALIVLLVLLATSVTLSLDKFNTPNPILSGIGLYKIMFTNVEIVQIQRSPQVYLAKPDNAQQALVAFMEQRGYDYLEDERMASTLVFENTASKVYVDFSVNAYYATWVLNE